MAPHDLQTAPAPAAAGFDGNSRNHPGLSPALSPTLNPALNPALNPEVDRLAHRLMLSAGKSGAGMNGDSWALIEEVLAFAADAEQRITEQREHIIHLESLSMTDELTGLANLRGMKRFLSRAIANARRYGEFGVVGFFDLDGFKAVNDAYGHAAGDAILRHVANILKAEIRITDMAARVGGDEFAVILNRAEWGHSATRLVNFQQAINAASIEFDGQRIGLRASMGLAPFGPTSNLKQVMATADEAMYADKRARIMRQDREKIAS